MAWTTPKTNWATGELVTAADLNAIGENLAAIRNMSRNTVAYTSEADTAISGSNTFEDVDSNFNLTITTTGGDVLVHFHGTVYQMGLRLDVDVDGVRQGDAVLGIRRGGLVNEIVSFTRLIQNLSPGVHTIKLLAKYSGAATLYAGAQFWVREI